MSSSTIPASRVVFGSGGVTSSTGSTGASHISSTSGSSGGGGSGGSGGGGGSGGTVPGVGGTAPAIPVVIKAKDWVTNKQIKIPILENQCSPAAFRVWLIKFEKYLNFVELLEIWNSKYEDRPQVINGNTLYEENQWIECDDLVGQLLSTAVGENKMADGYVAQSYLDPWRKTWSLIKQYFMPTGNNATAIQAGKVSALWRKTDETFRTFIRRIDTEMAFLKSLGGEQPDYVLNGLLRGGADPDYKTAVILGMAANQSYEFIRDQLLEILPHPAQNGGGNLQGRVNNVTSGGGNKSGGKSKSKTRNTIKNLNSKFQNMAGYQSGEKRKVCKRCKNLGHHHSECRADLSKRCSVCGKFGHITAHCKFGGNKQSTPPTQYVFQGHTVSNQQPTGQQVFYTMEAMPNMANVLVSSSNVAHTVPPKNAMRTVTFNQNTGPGVNGAPGNVQG